jgi:hypothetical protein
MGIFRRKGKRGRHRSGPRSLVHFNDINEDSPKVQKLEEAAAEDVRRVREDEKYFDKDAPANQDSL